MTDETILKAEDLFYSYDDNQTYALNGLSLVIRKHQKEAFMGANGSGKSRFFLCCVGICRPQKGKLYVGGRGVAYDKKGLLDL